MFFSRVQAVKKALRDTLTLKRAAWYKLKTSTLYGQSAFQFSWHQNL